MNPERTKYRLIGLVENLILYFRIYIPLHWSIDYDSDSSKSVISPTLTPQLYISLATCKSVFK